jgi:hypothetical protein
VIAAGSLAETKREIRNLFKDEYPKKEIADPKTLVQKSLKVTETGGRAIGTPSSAFRSRSSSRMRRSMCGWRPELGNSAWFKPCPFRVTEPETVRPIRGRASLQASHIV